MNFEYEADERMLTWLIYCRNNYIFYLLVLYLLAPLFVY